MTSSKRLSSSLSFSISSIAAALAGCLVLAGCAEKAPPSERPVQRDPNLLVVYSACALLPEIEAARDAFVAVNQGKTVEIVSERPPDLVKRIESGEVPDVFVCPGESEITGLERDGYVDRSSIQTMGALRTVVYAPTGNPARILRPEDLAAERVKTIAVPMPGTTSPGSDAKRELERLGLWEGLQEKLTVKLSAEKALIAVAEGEADAATLYDPCLRTAPTPAPESGEAPAAISPVPAESIQVVTPLSATESKVARISAITHKRSPNPILAQRFVRELKARFEAPAQPQTDPVSTEESPQPESAPAAE